MVAIASRAPRPGFRVYNLADTGPAVSMSEILLALETFGHRVPWTWQAAPAEAIPELTLDTARLRAALAGCPALACPSSGSELVAAWIRASGGAL